MSDGARPAMIGDSQGTRFDTDCAGGPPLRRRDLLRTGLAAAALAGPLSALGGGTAAAQAIRFFQIGTGTTGGTYFLIGGMLANAVSNPPGSRPCDRGGPCGVPGLIVVAQATSGAVENVLAMREGRMESGLVQADIAYAALLGKGPFKDAPPFESLRAIANLYTETIHLVVRADSGVQSLADLKGKRIGLGEKGSGTLVSARVLLAAYGLSEKKIKGEYLSPGPASDRLVRGELDAFFIIGGYPLPAVADLAARAPIRLLPFDDAHVAKLEQELPLFTGAVIEEGAYRDVPATRTLGIGAHWVVRGEVDPELVYGLTRALWHPNTGKLLAAGHPRGGSILIADALKALAVPLHPGAERFYREAGLIPETAAVNPEPTTTEPAPDLPAPGQ